MSTIIYNAIQTPDGTILESHDRHHYNVYVDSITEKEYMVDGGLDYLRRSAHDDQIELSVCLEDGHYKVRQALKWGTYGKCGTLPLHFITLRAMSTEHIRAVLDTCSIYPQYKNALENELKFRGELNEHF